MIDKRQVVEDTSRQLAQSPRKIDELIKGQEFLDAVEKMQSPIPPERFIRLVLNALLRTPKLQQCTKISVWRSVMELSMYGLEPDGRRAHLIPYENKKNGTVECQLILDYKGLAELVRRSGDVRSIHCDVVYGSDEFSFAYGSNKHLNHKPALDRGKSIATAYYSYVELKNGAQEFIVMSKAEVDKIRRRSRSADNGPWVTDYDEMGKKTAFRRHCKWLPLALEVKDAVERDEDAVDAVDWQSDEAPPRPPRFREKILAQASQAPEEEPETPAAEEAPAESEAQ